MHSPVWFIALAATGVVIGILAGMFGIGGGVLVIPALVFLFGFTQQRAIGTSLAMLLPPIGIFAFLAYYRAGQVHLGAAGLLAAGFAVGAYFGAKLVTGGVVPERLLQPLFACFMLYVAGNLLFRSQHRVWNTLSTLLLVAGFAIAYWVLGLIGRRLERSLSITEIYRERLERRVAPDYEI